MDYQTQLKRTSEMEGKFEAQNAILCIKETENVKQKLRRLE